MVREPHELKTPCTPESLRSSGVVFVCGQPLSYDISLERPMANDASPENV